jgi:hypothetical protein
MRKSRRHPPDLGDEAGWIGDSKMAGKKLPELTSDEEAEVFVETADLTQYDLSEGRDVRFNLKPSK